MTLSLTTTPIVNGGSVTIQATVGIDNTTNPATYYPTALLLQGESLVGPGNSLLVADAAVLAAIVASETVALPAGANTIGAVDIAAGQSIAINGGSVAIAGTAPVSLAALPALAAGTNIAGKFGIDQTTPGTTNKVSIGNDGTVVNNGGSVTLATGAATIGAVDIASGQSLAIASALPAGANNIGATAPIGVASIATGQAAMTTSAALIVAARPGAPGTGRATVTVVNSATDILYVGPAGVTSSTGFPLAAGAISPPIITTAALYGALASGTGTAAYMETF